MALLEDVGCAWEIGSAIVAVAIDNRDRTRSSGYVVPVVAVRIGTARNGEHYAQTEVIPANAPLTNRVGVSSGLEPPFVNH